MFEAMLYKYDGGSSDFCHEIVTQTCKCVGRVTLGILFAQKT